MSGQWVAHIVWWVGPIVGGVLAALLWEHILLPPEAKKAEG
jgi:glycerol uptake facilitator-like aquaporin